MDTEYSLKISVLPVGNKTVDCSGIIQWAETWDWSVGRIVAERLSDNAFSDWESIVVATITMDSPERRPRRGRKYERSDVFSAPDEAVMRGNHYNAQYAGFCILEKRDDWGTDLDIALTPFITAVYVDPKFRGRRISEKMLNAACDFLRALRFDTVYLISGEQGFYEKWGFEQFTQTVTVSGATEPVYKKRLR